MKTHSGNCGYLSRLLVSAFSGIAWVTFSVAANAAGQVSCSIANPGTIHQGTPVTFTGTVAGAKPPYTVTWTFPNATPGTVTTPNVPAGNTTANTTFTSTGSKTVTLKATDSSGGKKPKTCSASRTVTVSAPANVPPTARGDTYATPAGKQLVVQLSRVSGVLYNDFDTDPVTGESLGNAGLTAVKVSRPVPRFADPGQSTVRSPIRRTAARVITTTTASPTRRGGRRR